MSTSIKIPGPIGEKDTGLRIRLEEAEKVIAYYAKSSNWVESPKYSDILGQIDSDDLEQVTGFTEARYEGGKTARAYQKKYGVAP